MRRRLVLAGAAVSVVIAGALVVLVILLLRREPDKPAPAGGPASARIQPLPAPTEFVPDADPQATAHATVQASAVAIVALPDGARCVLPPGAAKPGSECRVSRLRNSPPRRGALELLSSAYEFSVDSAEDPLAATITLPFAPRRRKSAAPVALAAWNGVEWRPVASVVDGSTVTARVTHFSTYAVVSTPRFEAGPAEVYLSSLPGQGPARIPRGATVECVILRDPTGPAGRYDRVKLVGEENVEFGDGKGGFLRGEGTVQDAEVMGYYGVRGPGIEDVAKNVNEFRFQMRVPPGAPLGLRGIELSGSQVETLRYENAFDVCAPLVVIVDIDGMRQDVFYHAIQNPPAGFVHIPKLAGARTSAGADSIEFQHGVALRGAVTVFPTVTFAGHAAIFSGTDPGRYKIAGNEWFDRTLDVPYKFAFTGDNQGETGMGDSYDSFINGVANRRLLASGVTTVYQDAQREFGYRSVVAHNMYYGDGASAAAWASYGRLDMLLYLGKPKWLGGLWLLTPLSDRHMAAKARRAVLARDRYVTLGDQIGAEDARSLAIVTLYFAGLDHVSHESGSPRTVADPAAGYSGKQLDYLVESVDPYVGGFLESMTDVTYKNTTFIFVADHGQTTMNVQEGERGAKIRCFAQSRRVPTLHKFQDLLYETGYFPAGTYTLTGLDSGGTQIPARPVDASAVVGLNGGMAHVYLRRLAVGLRLEPPGPSLTLDDFTTRRSRVNQIFEAWRQPPRFQHVLDFAEAVRRWQEENPPSPEKAGDPEAAGYYRSLDLILVRDGEHGGFDAPYSVYVGPGNLVPFQEYLARNGNRPFSEPRYGWTSDARDIAFLADRLRRLQSAMSGDLILVPRYPDFYCEYVPLHGDHGGFTRSDFEVPFLVVRPGEAVARPLADAVRRSVDLSTKNRPSITDVKALVLNLLRPPAQATSTAGACEVLRRARDKIYSPVKRGAKAVSVLATPILPAPDPEDRDARPRPLCRAVRLHWKAPDRAMAEILDPDKDQLRT
ncbi:MAG: alkaline phosphatase family protein, partial [Planctomycetes bacterium]|nr:alkaline phosphatase family protein [Planctomycetota bacterium]